MLPLKTKNPTNVGLDGNNVRCLVTVSSILFPYSIIIVPTIIIPVGIRFAIIIDTISICIFILFRC